VVSEASQIKALRQAVGSNGIALGATESGFDAGTRPAVDVFACAPVVGTNPRKLFTQPL
jgi:outer membrane protein TolC